MSYSLCYVQSFNLQNFGNDRTIMSVEFVFQMPQLNPESMSMIGLNLFQQLSHLSKITNASCENPLSEDQVSCYPKNPKFLGVAVIILKSEPLYHRVMSPKDTDGMANGVDPDQTAPLGAV